MFNISIAERSHFILANFINKGDFAIDCTMGNGNDTLFLAEAVGKAGNVVAFDVQEKALVNTEKLVKLKKQVKLYLESNINISKYADREPSVIMYNLGYLPGGDKNITTKPDTLLSIKQAVDIIKHEGIISVITYPGHKKGFEEELLISEYLAKLPAKKYEVLTIKEENHSEKTPVQHFIFRK